MKGADAEARAAAFEAGFDAFAENCRGLVAGDRPLLCLIV